MDLCTLDFSALKPLKKFELLLELPQHLRDSTVGCSFAQCILAQTLFVTRIYNSYRRILQRCDIRTPLLLDHLLEQLWKGVMGQCSFGELQQFTMAAESVLVCLMTGDDDGLDEPFWNTYADDWDERILFNFCLNDTAAVNDILWQIVDQKITWRELEENQLISSFVISIDDFDLERDTGKQTSHAYIPAEYDRHLQRVYDTPTFIRIFSLLQEDLRLIRAYPDPTPEELQQLRTLYGEKSIYLPEQEARIAAILNTAQQPKA